jgi:hypothetical protein
MLGPGIGGSELQVAPVSAFGIPRQLVRPTPSDEGHEDFVCRVSYFRPVLSAKTTAGLLVQLDLEGKSACANSSRGREWPCAVVETQCLVSPASQTHASCKTDPFPTRDGEPLIRVAYPCHESLTYSDGAALELGHLPR